ncbi:MAG: hypothetical protein ILP22_08305 [Oscillospiraceae bacterium]|nr:hypothetical protein [Oscillospiraceae bacterium]
MVVPIDTLIADTDRFIRNEAEKRKYGDIIVKITMNDGVPVRLETAICEHIARRTTTKCVVIK